MAQRFGPYSFVVNTDKVSRATAEDQGWDLWNDRRQRRQVRRPGIRRLERLQPLLHRRLRSVQGAHATRRWRNTPKPRKRVFKGAKLVGDIATMNQSLVSGEIDFHLTGGTYSRLAGARRRQPEHPRHHAEEGPDGGRQGRHLVDRDHLGGQQSRTSRRWPPSSWNMSRIRDGRTRGRLRRRHLQSGRPDGQSRIASSSSPRKSSTRSSGTAWKRRWRARSNTTSCPTMTSCSTS